MSQCVFAMDNESSRPMISISSWQWNWLRQLVLLFDFFSDLSVPISGAHDSKTHVHVCAHIHSFVWLWNWPCHMYLKHAEAQVEFGAIKSLSGV